MTQITRTKFNRLDAVELTTKSLRLVAVTQSGPRIAHFGTRRGGNLLLWKPGKYKRGDWDLRGGHRVWVTRPGADENEDTYATDNGRCKLEIYDDGFCVIGAENRQNRTQRGFSVTVQDHDRLEVDNFVINSGDMLYSGGIWALTCTLPSQTTKYAVPIGDGTEWDAFTMVAFRRWAGHGQGGFNDPQIKVGKDLVTVTPRGVENKRMIQSLHGIIAMSDPGRKITFAKKCGWDPAAVHPLNTNIAFYIGPDNFMVEMETMGPECSLRPGNALHHTETWVLRPQATPLTGAKRLLELFY